MFLISDNSVCIHAKNNGNERISVSTICFPSCDVHWINDCLEKSRSKPQHNLLRKIGKRVLKSQKAETDYRRLGLQCGTNFTPTFVCFQITPYFPWRCWGKSCGKFHTKCENYSQKSQRQCCGRLHIVRWFLSFKERAVINQLWSFQITSLKSFLSVSTMWGVPKEKEKRKLKSNIPFSRCRK